MFRDVAVDAPRLAQISLTEEGIRWLKGCVVGRSAKLVFGVAAGYRRCKSDG